MGVLTPLAGGPLLLATLMVFIPQLIGDGLQTIEGIAELSLIQGVIPDRILGRVNATLEVFSHGVAYPLGALMAAAVAGWIGVRGGDRDRLGRDGGLHPAARPLAAAAHPAALRRARGRGLKQVEGRWMSDRTRGIMTAFGNASAMSSRRVAFAVMYWRIEP